MSIFGSYGKNITVSESVDDKYMSETIINNPYEVKKLMLEIVKSVFDMPGKGLLDNDEKDLEEKRHLIKKTALAVLKQLGYGSCQELKIKIISELEKYLWGYYVLDDLVNDLDVSDIRVLDWNYIRYKKMGKRYMYETHFLDREDYIQFVNLLAVRNKKSLSDVNAITYFTDTGNKSFILRFNICTQIVSSNKIPILTIRKIPKEKYSLQELINKGMLDYDVANYLINKAKYAGGILFTGKGASGKTTLLNTLLEYIDENESAVVIQESDELFISSKIDNEGNEIPSRDIAFLHTVTCGSEGKTEYTMPELTRNGLRMDLDYYIIGEIKGDEAEGFSMASYTGHKCWATVHGMNSYEGINKLADYIKQSTGYEFEDCLKKLIGMEVVIFMKEFKVCEITEISGYDNRQGDLVKKVIFSDGKWL